MTYQGLSYKTGINSTDYDIDF